MRSPSLPRSISSCGHGSVLSVLTRWLGKATKRPGMASSAGAVSARVAPRRLKPSQRRCLGQVPGFSREYKSQMTKSTIFQGFVC